MRNYPPTGGFFSLRPKPGRLWVPPSAMPGDTTAPAITSVTASAGTYYFVGRTLTLTATFDEAVTVTGTPRISLTIGSNTRYATYASGTGTTTLVFAYTFVAGDTSAGAGFTATSPIDLNSGTIKDASGNNATLTFSAPSMSAKRAIMRGVTWATDFETPAVPDLPGVVDGTTISAAVGMQGTTINSDSADPTWIPGEGARYDGGDRFSNLPYDGGYADYIDTTTTWSLHTRFYLPTGASHSLWNSGKTGESGQGTSFLQYGVNGKLYAYNINNHPSGGADGGYFAPGIAVDAAAAYYTVSFVCSAAGAGGIKVYVNGVQTGTITAATVTEQDEPDAIQLGFRGILGVDTSANVKTRLLTFSNVAHSADEVADMHAFAASLPNAA